MKSNNKVFIKYYDNLYSGKDYTAEINQILNVWKSERKRKLSLVLDIGSGTGNHSFQFAERGYNIVGVDIEKDMFNISSNKLKKIKTKNVNFILPDIQKKKLSQPSDLGYSFFFVINYITSLEYLVNFLKGVKRNLKKDGMYIFNSWNGNATTVDPPRIKDINVENNGVKIVGNLNPRYEAKFNLSQYLYTLEINDNGKVQKINYEIPQIYWPPLVLKEACLMAGFKKVKIYKHLSLNENFDKSDYVLDFACFA